MNPTVARILMGGHQTRVRKSTMVHGKSFTPFARFFEYDNGYAEIASHYTNLMARVGSQTVAGSAFSRAGRYLALALSNSSESGTDVTGVVVWDLDEDREVPLASGGVNRARARDVIFVTNESGAQSLVAGTDRSPFLMRWTVGATEPWPINLLSSGAPTGAVNKLDVADNGSKTFLVAAHAISPFVSVYKMPSSTSWSKLANPGTLPAGTGNYCSINSLGTRFAVAHNNSPNISIYSISVTDVITKLSNPSTLPVGNGTMCRYAPVLSRLYFSSVSTPVSYYNTSNFTLAPTTIPASPGTTSGLVYLPTSTPRYAIDLGTSVEIRLESTNEIEQTVASDGAGQYISFSPLE